MSNLLFMKIDKLNNEDNIKELLNEDNALWDFLNYYEYMKNVVFYEEDIEKFEDREVITKGDLFDFVNQYSNINKSR